MITTTSKPFSPVADAAAPDVHLVNSRRVRTVKLPGPAGSLEAVVNEGSPDAPFAAVVCHPHPVGGGTMHNKVVYHAMKALNAPQWSLEWPVLRFNFRGTGRSHGVHDGEAEAGDVLAALDWLRNEYRRPLVVAGFSFGAAMALAACCSGNQGSKDVRAIAAIGLPIRSGAARSDAQSYDYSFLARCAIPKLFLSGDQDEFAPQAELIQAAAIAAPPKQTVLVPGADHFFTGQLEPMQTALSGWLKEHVL
jgi:uncharacterized protein